MTKPIVRDPIYRQRAFDADIIELWVGWNNKYLNNIVEQNHRAIKRRCASMAGFKSFANAAITISGIDLAHRIHKGQFALGRGRRLRGWSRKDEWATALA